MKIFCNGIYILLISIMISPQAGAFGQKLKTSEYDQSSPATGNMRYGGAHSADASDPNWGYTPSSDASCSVSCSGGGAIQVDLTARCMCVSGFKCFKINIGSAGPGMTTSGHGTLGQANGAKYQTLSSASTGYDKDAMAMGIPGNDGVGKWIHKARGCYADGRANTAGCVAVPCANWPQVKAKMGQSLDVCRGGGQDNSSAGTSSNNGQKTGTQ